MNWRSLIYLVVVFDLVIWGYIFYPATNFNQGLVIYFLDVGQGDSELINLDDLNILVDGGPDTKILENLSGIFPLNKRYLDLVILTHPHLDHFGGLIDVLKNYQAGVFLDSGFSNETKQYQYFKKEIADKNIRHFDLREGDKIRYKDLELDVISPSVDARPVKTKDIHDNTIVFLLKKGNLRALFTGDINFKVESRLLRDYKNLTATILKVSHHGSNKSSSAEFLAAVQPQMAFIEVGKNNQYGHPKQALLDRLKAVGAKIYRTDENGTARVSFENNKLVVSLRKK